MDQGPRMQLQTGVKMGWTRLYDMAGVTTLSSAIIANNDWLKDAKNQSQLRGFLRATQRGWQYTFDNRDEAAEIFHEARPGLQQRDFSIGDQRHYDNPAYGQNQGQADWLVRQRGLEGIAGCAREVRQVEGSTGRQRLLHERIPLCSAVQKVILSDDPPTRFVAVEASSRNPPAKKR